MTTALATVPATEDPRELALLKAVGLDRLAPEQRELALNIAARYELDLLLKHLVMIDGRPYITRDGLLHIAHRSGQLDGIETTEPAIVDDFWRASCSVWRKDMSRAFTYTGRYPTKGGNQRFAPEMATKVAEVMALRRAFDVAAPTLEERWDIEVPAEPPAPKPTLAAKVAEKAAEVAKPDTLPTKEPEPETETEPSAKVDDEPWSYARFREAMKGVRPTAGAVVQTAARMVPGRDLELHEPKTWTLEPHEWALLADELADA
jgi:hypothetical protein